MISIVIATYNSELLLRSCLQSIDNQTDNSFELIIIDGGSTDNTIDIIEQYSSIVSYSISEKDNGIYDAWNKGVVKSTQPWVMFIGSDDRLKSSQSIEKINRNLKKVDNYDFIYGINQIVDQNYRHVRYAGTAWNKIRFDFFCGIMKVPHPGMLHRTSLFNEYGLFDTSFKIAGDYDFMLRVLLKRERIYFSNKSSQIIVAEGGVSQNFKMRIASLLEVKQSMKKNGISSNNFLLQRYIIRTYLFRGLYYLLPDKLFNFIKSTRSRNNAN